MASSKMFWIVAYFTVELLAYANSATTTVSPTASCSYSAPPPLICNLSSEDYDCKGDGSAGINLSAPSMPTAYSLILSPAIEGAFVINETTGYFYLVDPQPVRPFANRLSVWVKTWFSGQYQCIKWVNITFTNVTEDARLSFTENHYIFFAREDIDLATNLGCLKTFTADKDTIHDYTILDENVPFKVSQDGSLRVDKELNYEETKQYTFTVQVSATASESGLVKASVPVTVFVQDVDDVAPVFMTNQTTIMYEVSQNSDQGDVIGVLDVEDRDTDFSELIYSIDPAIKEVIGVTPLGVLFLRSRLSVTANYPRFSVTVHDTKGSFDTTFVVVRLIDLPENDEENEINVMIKFPENQPIGSLVNTLTLAGSEGSNPVFLMHTASDLFHLANDTGALTSLHMFDREDRDEYRLLVDVIGDKCQNLAVLNILIDVTDQNDNRPTFSQEQYEYSIREDSLQDFLLVISGSDADMGENSRVHLSINGTTAVFNYSVTPALSQNGLFQFEFGILPVAFDMFDYETLGPDKRLVFDMTVSDAGSLPLNSSALLILNILDANDNSPSLSCDLFDVTISENYTGPVGQCVAMDRDSGENSRVVFSILDSDVFIIDRRTGNIAVLGLDYEKERRHDFVVLATDAGFPRRTNQTTLSISVIDVNDNFPIFEQSFYSAQVNENYTGEVTLIISATDADVNDQILYHLEGSDSEFFTLSGVNLSVSSELDFENSSRQDLQFVVKAMDMGNKIATATVLITVVNVNDERPSFSSMSQSVTIHDGTQSEKPITVVNAIDKDNLYDATYNRVVYSLKPETDFFTIDNETGVVTSGQIVSLIAMNSSNLFNISGVAMNKVQLTATATDSVWSSDIQIYISIVPQFTSPSQMFLQDTYTGNVTENQNVGTTVTLSGQFVDSASTGDVSYQLIGPTNEFGINSSTGEILTKVVLDREAVSLYTALVKATNSSNRIFEFVQVDIRVDDDNDRDPRCDLLIYHRSITENNPPGYSLINITATDSDLGQNGQFTFSINNNKDFVISPDGLLTVRNSLDREDAASHSIVVMVTDKGNRSSSCMVEVNVEDVNDNAPSFVAGSNRYVVRLLENSPEKTNLMTLTAVDPDDPSAAVKYTLSDGQGYFNLKDNILMSTTRIDRETDPIFNVTVFASDDLWNSSVVITIEIDDENDNSPIFVNSTYTMEISSSLSVGSEAIRVHADDPDSGQNGNVTYSFQVGDAFAAQYLNIDKSQGRITITRPLYNLTSAHQSFSVLANDIDPSHTATSLVTLVVNGLNLHAPEFSSRQYTATILEETKVTEVITISASDKDDDSNITHSLIGNTDLFTIHPVTGVISTSELMIDRDKLTVDVITLNVSASDNGRPLRQSSVVVLITVEDINDNIPQFPSSTWEIYVNHTFKAGETFSIPKAVDMDASDAFRLIRYEAFLPSLYRELFMFVEAGGELAIISVSNCSDFCVRPESYSLAFTVYAYNPGYDSPSNISRLDVQLTILYQDLNLHYPKFSDGESIARTVSRSSPVGADVITVTALDDDDGPEGEITFTIISPDPRIQSIFNISSSVNGRATVRLAFKFDDVDEYSFIINAMDRARRPKSMMLNVSIEVVGDEEACQDVTILIAVCVAGSFILIILISILVWEITSTRIQEEELNRYYRGEQVGTRRPRKTGSGYNEISGHSGYDKLNMDYSSAAGWSATSGSGWPIVRAASPRERTLPDGAEQGGYLQPSGGRRSERNFGPAATNDQPMNIPRPTLTSGFGLAALHDLGIGDSVNRAPARQSRFDHLES